MRTNFQKVKFETKKMAPVTLVDRFAPDIFPPRRDAPADYVTFNFGKTCDLSYPILEKYRLITALRTLSSAEYDKNILFSIGYDSSTRTLEISMVLIIYHWSFHFS